ncbi:MAG TPA: TolC family protein [Flavitalea sp.]|nr:TolC family protein [Flavitalea sp.]
MKENSRWKKAAGLLTALAGIIQVSIAQEVHTFSVQQSVEFAMKNSAQVKNALIGIQIQQQTNREITAAAFPQLNGNITINYFPKVPVQSFPNFISAATYGVLQDEGVKDGNGNPIISPGDFGFIQAQFGTKYTGTAGLELSQLLFDGQVFIGLKARSAAMNFSRKAAEVTQEQIKANVHKIYYQLVVGRKQMGTFDANIARLEKLLHDTKEIYKNGFAEKLDVSKVDVSLNNLITERSRINNQLSSGLLGLKLLLGMPAKDSLVLTDSLTDADLKEDILEGVYTYADRKEFQQLELAKKLGQLNVKRYQLTYIPTVAAFGSYSKNAQRDKFNFFNFKEKWFTTALIGLKVSVPIFDGFARDARIKRAKLELMQTENNLQNLQLLIDNEVQTARNNMRSAILSMDLQKRNMVLAEEVYEQTKKKYEQGLGSNIEITNAQTELRIAQTNYYSALYDAIIARIDYRKAAGIL